MKQISLTKEYKNFIVEIKKQIQISQTKAITKVNRELIVLYFTIGKIISQKQEQLGWGAKVIDNLSSDIKVTFPDLDGFSVRNIKRMVRFYKEYEKVPPLVAQLENEKMPLLVAQIPWTHNTILIEKIKDMKLRYWYINKIIEHGWSKNILSIMIQSEIHKREGKLTSNFKDILPSNDSDLVQQSFKDPYIFDFLTMAEPFRERELELNLIEHKDDNPTIGLILCQEKNEVVAEYSLKNMSQPIGISEYELTEVLPKEFESSLPTIEMIEDELKSSLDN